MGDGLKKIGFATSLIAHDQDRTWKRIQQIKKDGQTVIGEAEEKRMRAAEG